MIAPDSAAELRAERRFDLIAAVLIGLIAVLAAILAATQTAASQTATRADVAAARLAADLSTRIAVSSQALDSSLGAQQIALMLGVESASRQLAATRGNDTSALAVGAAEDQAFGKFATGGRGNIRHHRGPTR